MVDVREKCKVMYAGQMRELKEVYLNIQILSKQEKMGHLHTLSRHTRNLSE